MYFSNIEELKKFIFTKKWVDIKEEDPCYKHAVSITIKDGYLNEYNGIELSRCKIKNIKLLNLSTLEITIKNNCNYSNTFKVEIINFKERLVKWTSLKNKTFNAKPYVDICKETKDLDKRKRYWHKE